MKMIGVFLLVIANAGLFSILESKPGTLLYYFCVGSISVFFVFCYAAIVKLQSDLDRLKRLQEETEKMTRKQ